MEKGKGNRVEKYSLLLHSLILGLVRIRHHSLGTGQVVNTTHNLGVVIILGLAVWGIVKVGKSVMYENFKMLLTTYKNLPY